MLASLTLHNAMNVAVMAALMATSVLRLKRPPPPPASCARSTASLTVSASSPISRSPRSSRGRSCERLSGAARPGVNARGAPPDMLALPSEAHVRTARHGVATALLFALFATTRAEARKPHKAPAPLTPDQQ